MNHIDTTALITAYNDFTSKKSPFQLSNHYSVQAFIPHILAAFASVPLVYRDDGISMMDTMKSVINSSSSFLSLTGKQISQLVMFAGEVNRSKLYSSAYKEHTFKAFTPLFMYAHKLYNNVEYTEWNKDDEAIQYALGRTLYKCLEHAKKNSKPDFTTENIKALRANLMTVKKTGEVKQTLNYKMLGWEGVPPDIMRMELQTWIANAELRDEKAMILDIWDWGHIPESYDVLLPESGNITPRLQSANEGIPLNMFD